MSVAPLFNLRAEIAQPELGRPLSCTSCGLHRDALHPKIQPYGENRRRIMVLGEAPGAEEDEKDKPWQGRAGRFLQGALRELGVSLFEDCVSLNAANCRPPSNRTPTDYETACCRRIVVNPAIREHAPRLILLLGGPAVTSVLGPLCAEALGAKIGRWRGFAIPIPELGAWACPTYHPSYILREDKRPEIETVFKQDLRCALALLDTLVPRPEDLRNRVEILRAEDEILWALHEAHDVELLAVDYETLGLQSSVHRIICASFATSADHAHAFMMPTAGPVRDAWARLMADPRVGKIAHNMRFEDSWTRQHFGVEDINWAWDSMVGAHIVDNRVGVCGLKLQAFLNFGTRSWGDEIEPYLRAKDTPTAPNKIQEFIERYGEDECLTYCAIDALVSYRLAMRQREVIR